MKYVALLIALTGMAVAQTHPKFVDNSPAGNPLSLAASKDSQEGRCSLKLHDNDQRPVVAVVVAFDADPREDQRMSHDHFFRSDDQIEMHGTDFDMSFDCTQQTVIMTTKLVQFNDGEVWNGSDAKTVRALAANRRESIDYLHELLTAPDTKEALAKTQLGHWNSDGSFITGKVSTRGVLMLATDPTAAAKDWLANAESHASWLLNLK